MSEEIKKLNKEIADLNKRVQELESFKRKTEDSQEFARIQSSVRQE